MRKSLKRKVKRKSQRLNKNKNNIRSKKTRARNKVKKSRIAKLKKNKKRLKNPAKKKSKQRKSKKLFDKIAKIKKISKNRKQKDQKKTFILPSILITTLFFAFFQLTIYFDKNFAKKNSQVDFSLDESKKEGLTNSQKENIVEETEDENSAEFEKITIDNSKVKEIEDIEEKQLIKESISDLLNINALDQQIDIEESTIKDNNTLNAKDIQNQLASSLDNNLVCRADDLKEKTVQYKGINNIEKEGSIKKDKAIFNTMLNDKPTLKEKSDEAVSKMMYESSFRPDEMEQEITKVLNNYFQKRTYDFKPIAYPAQKTISKNNVSNNLKSYDSVKESKSTIIGVQNDKLCKENLAIGYNAPARIDICGGIKSFLIGEFIYWSFLGDQLDLGVVNITSPTPQGFYILKFKTDYQPGFKVGVGTYFKRDDWDIFAQYTRIHKTEYTYFNPANKTGTFNTSWFLTSVSSFNLSAITSDIKGYWKVDLDKIDLELGRSFYLGSFLVARPFVSLSSHILEQKYDLSLTTSQLYSSSTKNASWSIGPRLGILTSWILRQNFKIFLNGSISLMYAENQITGFGDENLTAYSVKKVDKKILRNVEEIKLGLGWGSYFTHNKWHFDILAAYEAQRYSHTNYMSYTSQINLETNEIKPGDLYMHGLTFSTRFDF